jgi:hypothetical protein
MPWENVNRSVVRFSLDALPAHHVMAKLTFKLFNDHRGLIGPLRIRAAGLHWLRCYPKEKPKAAQLLLDIPTSCDHY